MKLFRFVGEQELIKVLHGETIVAINDHSDRPNTFNDKDAVYMIPYRDEDHIIDAMFDTLGVVDAEYVVVVDMAEPRVTLGYGRYANSYLKLPRGYRSAKNFKTGTDWDNDMFDPENPDMWAPEATVKSYDYSDIINVYEITDSSELKELTSFELEKIQQGDY